MTLLTVPASVNRRAPVRRGWRPMPGRPFPTLGWDILGWTYAMLPSPSNERQPFVFTDEQARRVLRIYELDPETGRPLYRRVTEEEAKGWGKGPFAAALAIVEFRGPVCFNGWDANGQPVGVPWGTGDRPRPWIQIAAVSEDQTKNTWRPLQAFLTDNDGNAAEQLRLDPGRTVVYSADDTASKMELVTASAASREGQPITHAVMDEVQLWKPSNGGDALARTILRNLTKTNGWAHLTCNAPIEGQGSVAELYGKTGDGSLHLATRASEQPRQDWSVERKRAELDRVYGDVPWISRDRVLADMADEATPWMDSVRFFFNWRPKAGATSWMPGDAWAGCSHPEVKPTATEPTYACVRIGRDHRSAALAWAQRHGDTIVLRSRIFTSSDLVAPDLLDLQPIESFAIELRKWFPARVVAEQRIGSQRQKVARPGPELVYDGTFFERSAQALDKAGMVLVDRPNSAQWLAPAAETLYGLVLSGKLAHDGSADLESQILAIEAEPADKGWFIRAPERADVHTEAAIAAMVAVHRAMTEERPRTQTLATFRSW